ncbi:ABC transporter substrate-binding protein [Methylobacterium aquaticum]|uniref:ABC transporter substrate-binding protein n=1 Tax=Methylobacterium aquaticum TaxID=270351 RepID=A0A0J6VKL4_9HYPH|nr:ABC transporter substrate-binding protein [Methylobacterium aquaticum]KMO39671.1 ABC transporter substrate-binding protein [Methylobacterium aquaticum]
MVLRTRSSRRHLLAGALLAGFALPGFAWAAPRTDLVLGMPVEPPGLDPTSAAPTVIGQVVWQNVFEGLTRVDRDGQVQPQLAKSWTVSPDGLTYTFALQTGVRFHNGEPFDATTAKFALDAIRAPGSVNPQKALYAVIADVKAPDPATLVLTLSKPSGNLLFWLGLPAAVMVDATSRDTLKSNPVGTGPFRFAAWRKGDRVELTRSPDHWNTARKVHLDKVTFRFIGDPQAAVAALRAGDLDAYPLLPAPELYGAFQKDKAFTAVPGLTEMKVVAGMNNAAKPFSDKRVRQALMMAVDRKLLIEGAYSGYGVPIGSHYTPNDPGYKDLTGLYPYDPAKAKALLAEAGYAKGLTFTFKSPQMAYASRTAEILQAMFSEIGVTMTIVPTEFPAKWVQEVMRDRSFDMTVIAHAEPMDIAIYANDPYYFGYKNPAFADVVTKAAQATDEATRLARYGDAQTILAEDVPALFLFVLPKLSVWKAKLTGFWQNEPVPSNDLTEVRWTE